MDDPWHRVAVVRRKIDRVGSVPLHPITPICTVFMRYPCGHGLGQKYRAQGEAIAKDRLLIAFRLRLRNRIPQGRGFARSVKASEKRKRHTSADVHPDLVEQARVEVDRRPTPIEPEKFDLEDSEVAELSTEAANGI
ncbi:hypothetical protein GALL_481940 [mine drainage metagenome]|uniref:Uncharacterized protein n=1 Tax=mine drainage metagenome TaxID=410659 RepID=A0A1J5PRI8_9ZZZZ